METDISRVEGARRVKTASDGLVPDPEKISFQQGWTRVDPSLLKGEMINGKDSSDLR